MRLVKAANASPHAKFYSLSTDYNAANNECISIKPLKPSHKSRDFAKLCKVKAQTMNVLCIIMRVLK